MGRPAKPWYRSAEDWWYATIVPGTMPERLVKGRKNRKQAETIFYARKASKTIVGSLEAQPVAVLLEAFLDHAKDSCKPTTYETYSEHCNYLSEFCGNVRCSQIVGAHAEKLIRSRKWSPNTQATFIKIIRTCFNWGLRHKLVSHNPFLAVQKPFTEARQSVLSDAQLKKMLKATDPVFRDFLTALRNTGCRPSEVASVTADQVALDRWTLTEHKTDSKGPKVVWLNPTMVAMTKRLTKEHPEGPLFRNSRGKKWTKNAIVLRFRRLRTQLKLDKSLVAYSLRHQFVTEALANEVPIATVAELVGHTSTRMIEKHYSKLGRKTEYMREAIKRATRRSSVSA